MNKKDKINHIKNLINISNEESDIESQLSQNQNKISQVQSSKYLINNILEFMNSDLSLDFGNTITETEGKA